MQLHSEKTLAAFTDYFRSSALNEPRVVPACLTTILQILKELSNGVYAGNFSAQPVLMAKILSLFGQALSPGWCGSLAKREMKLMSPIVLKSCT